MSKQEQKKTQKNDKPKKGRVIDRGRNRTLSHNQRMGEPKWQDIGEGVLVRAGQPLHGIRANPIRLEGGGFRSLSHQPAPVIKSSEDENLLYLLTGKSPSTDI